MNCFVVRFRAPLTCAFVSIALLGGCASVSNPRDPFEPINRGIYTFNDALDTTVLKPAAVVYKGVVPSMVRTGVHNVFSNINDVIVALNNLLQGKFQTAASDVGRLALNTTVGLLGLFDVATPAGLEKHEEDFGQTLGYWGIGSGPYLVLPVFGPSTVRDSVGLFVDYQTNPITYVDPVSDRNILWGVQAVNRRSELLEAERVLETAALDKYQFVRDAYLQRRRNLVYDGKPPPEHDEDIEKKKPRSEGRGPLRASDEAPLSILVSGDPPTPARLEALEQAMRRAARGPDAPAQTPDRHAAAPASKPHFFRFWASRTAN